MDFHFCAIVPSGQDLQVKAFCRQSMSFPEDNLNTWCWIFALARDGIPANIGEAPYSGMLTSSQDKQDSNPTWPGRGFMVASGQKLQRFALFYTVVDSIFPSTAWSA